MSTSIGEKNAWPPKLTRNGPFQRGRLSSTVVDAAQLGRRTRRQPRRKRSKCVTLSRAGAAADRQNVGRLGSCSCHSVPPRVNRCTWVSNMSPQLRRLSETAVDYLFGFAEPTSLSLRDLLASDTGAANVDVDHMLAVFSKLVNEWFDQDGGHFQLIGDELWSDGARSDDYYWGMARYEDMRGQALARASESA
jgi:hypothetical protein